MRRRRPASLVLATLQLVLPLAAASCVTDKVTGERRFALVTWTTAEEQRIGDSAAPNFEQQFGGGLPDAASQRYLAGVVAEMTSHSVRKDDFPWKFEILDASEPNAFALPGGYVYVTRGLLQNLESEGEFVAVLGHELGHVEHQHSMLQQNKAIAGTVLVSLIGVGEELLQKDPDQPHYVSALAGMAVPLGLLHFSREQESEADLRGVHFAHAMGYDPREMKKTFEYFERLERQAGSSTPSFLRDHPTNETRIAEIDRTIEKRCPEVISKSPAAFRSPPGPNDRFVQIVASLKKKAPAYQKHDEATALLAKSEGDAAALGKALELANQACNELPGEPLFQCLAGEIEYSRGGGDRGRARFEKARAAMKFGASAGGSGGPSGPSGKEYWKPVFYLGVLDVEAGHAAPAVANLRRAAELFPDQPLAAYYLGRAHELNHDSAAATAAYEQVTQLAPAESALHQKAAERLQALSGEKPATPATPAKPAKRRTTGR